MTLALYQVTVSHAEGVAVGSYVVVNDEHPGPDGGSLRDLGWLGVRVADLVCVAADMPPGPDGQAYTCRDCEADFTGTCEAHRPQAW